MLLKCNKCGHENQLGAIFCRECGEKLDVDKMRPKVENKKSRAPIGDIIRNIVAIAVILGIVMILVLMFFPEGGSPYALDKEDKQKTDTKFQSVMDKIGGETGEDEYIFTPDEVTYLFNNKLTKTETEEGVKAVDVAGKMTFSIDNNNNIVIIAETTIFGSFPASFKLTGTLVEEKAKLKVTGARMGHLNFPFAHEKIIAQFEELSKFDVIQKIIEATDKLTIEEGNFHISVKALKGKRKR